GDLVVDGVGRKQHVVGPGARRVLAEAVDVVDVAHPVLAVAADTASAAGVDLRGNDSVAATQPAFRAGFFTQSHALGDEFMPGRDRRLAVAAGGVGRAPEHGRAEIAFQVAGADAGIVYAGQHLSRPGSRYRQFLQPVVFGAVAD